jgi:hypothetical protein
MVEPLAAREVLSIDADTVLVPWITIPAVPYLFIRGYIIQGEVEELVPKKSIQS